jgi:hypothetical protein
MGSTSFLRFDQVLRVGAASMYLAYPWSIIVCFRKALNLFKRRNQINPANYIET